MHRLLPLSTAMLLFVAAPVLAGKAHEHGVARLDVAVEQARVTFLLEVPLDGLVGFEREPRSDAERAAVDAALARLRAPEKLFGIDSAAGCTAGKVTIESAALGLGGAASAKDGHADLDASFEFNCRNGQQAGFVEVSLFDAFARLQRVEVQAATRKGQLKATLKRPTTRLPLAR